MYFGRPGPGLQVWVFIGWLYQRCICTNYPNQWGNVDSSMHCPHLKPHETMNLKN